MKKSIAAVVSFLIAVLMAAALIVFSSREEVALVEVVRVKNNVIPSTVILSESLEKVKIPQTSLTDNMITDLEEARGKIAKSFIGKGSILYKYQIDSEVNLLGLKQGEVPLRIKTDLVTFGGARPGDYVDVLAIEKKGTREENGVKIPVVETKVLLSNVRVVNHVLSGGATRTLLRNQLYKEQEVVEVRPENATTLPMEIEKLEYPVAVDLAVTPEQAMMVDKAVAEGAQIKLRVNPWDNWKQQVQNAKSQTE